LDFFFFIKNGTNMLKVRPVYFTKFTKLSIKQTMKILWIVFIWNFGFLCSLVRKSAAEGTEVVNSKKCHQSFNFEFFSVKVTNWTFLQPISWIFIKHDFWWTNFTVKNPKKLSKCKLTGCAFITSGIKIKVKQIAIWCKIN